MIQSVERAASILAALGSGTPRMGVTETADRVGLAKPTVYGLLRTLASEPARVFTREELLQGVWGFKTVVPTRTLDSHASRLRKKLTGGDHTFVVNVWGVGYRLVDSVPPR